MSQTSSSSSEPARRADEPEVPEAQASAAGESIRKVMDEVSLLVRARYPIIYLVSWEEERVVEALRQVARETGKTLFPWTQTAGFTTMPDGAKAQDPHVALQLVLGSPDRAIFLLKDFHAHLEDRKVVRRLRDCVASLKQSWKTLVILSPVADLPRELEKDVTVIDVPLPDAGEIRRILEEFLGAVRRRGDVTVDAPKELVEQAVHAALGLTSSEARNVFAKVIVEDRRFDESDIPRIYAEKKQIIRKSGVLEYYEPSEGMGDIGGLDGLKQWLTNRSIAFTEKARAYGLPEPKGLLLLGVQGCGKSLTAKAVSALWRLPLVRLDVGSLFGSYIGSSEANMRKAIRTAESLAPAVLWLDEIEKGLSGMRGSGGGDSGTTARVFGTFLTWLQEKTQPVFVIATANSIADLPPELLRKGRFDEIFFIDLPTVAERAPIIEIHLAKRSRDPRRFDIGELATLSEGFSGAEIEQAIISAMYAAFPEDRDIRTADVARALKETVPLSQTMREQVDALREWASRRARPASRGGGA